MLISSRPHVLPSVPPPPQLEVDLAHTVHRIAVPLAGAGISIFQISTFDADFTLVPETDFVEALDCLRPFFTISSSAADISVEETTTTAVVAERMQHVPSSIEYDKNYEGERVDDVDDVDDVDGDGDVQDRTQVMADRDPAAHPDPPSAEVAPLSTLSTADKTTTAPFTMTTSTSTTDTHTTTTTTTTPPTKHSFTLPVGTTSFSIASFRQSDALLKPLLEAMFYAGHDRSMHSLFSMTMVDDMVSMVVDRNLLSLFPADYLNVFHFDDPNDVRTERGWYAI